MERYHQAITLRNYFLNGLLSNTMMSAAILATSESIECDLMDFKDEEPQQDISYFGIDAEHNEILQQLIKIGAFLERFELDFDRPPIILVYGSGLIVDFFELKPAAKCEEVGLWRCIFETIVGGQDESLQTEVASTRGVDLDKQFLEMCELPRFLTPKHLRELIWTTYVQTLNYREDDVKGLTIAQRREYIDEISTFLITGAFPGFWTESKYILPLMLLAIRSIPYNNTTSRQVYC